MTKESRLLTVIKSKQFVLISRAGMAVPSYEMSAEQIHRNMSTQFRNHVENYRMPNMLAKFPRNNFFRTCKHLTKVVQGKYIHTGVSLWRKFAQIRKYVNNVITPAYAKNLGPNGQLPSGFTIYKRIWSQSTRIWSQSTRIWS